MVGIKQKTVLIVDDEKVFLENLLGLLSLECKFLTAENEAEGLLILENNSVDLILLDQNLKETLGTSFLKKVVKRFPLILFSLNSFPRS